MSSRIAPFFSPHASVSSPSRWLLHSSANHSFSQHNRQPIIDNPWWRGLMSIWKSTTAVVVLVALLGGAVRRGAAQGGNGDLEEKTPLVVSGFAVGLGSYDRNLAQNTALGSKLALSIFRPWSDQLYFFGQLTTHLEQSDSGPPGTAIEIDNLIINWTPKRLSTLTLSFGRFDAPIGFERDDEPLNLVPTTSFTFENARPVKFTGLMARYTLNPKVSVLGLAANGWDQEADNNSGKTGGLKVQLFPTSRLAVAAGAPARPDEGFPHPG